MTQPAGAGPPGSLISKDYQYEFRGLLIGSGTPYTTAKMTGLLDQPTIVQYHSKAVARHGVYYGYEVFDARTVAFDVQAHSEPGDYFAGGLTAGQATEKLIDEFADAFNIANPFANELTVPLTQSAIDDPLIIKRPGKAMRQMFCHVTKRLVPVTGDIAMGLAAMSAELYCGDPVVYSLATKAFAGAIAGGATTSNTFNIRNEGNFPCTKLVATIIGPGGGGSGAQLWTITNLTTSNSLKLNMTILATDTVVIDFNQKSIQLNGVDSYGFRRPDGNWWSLVPGDNLIQMTRQTTDGVGSSISTVSYDAFNSA